MDETPTRTLLADLVRRQAVSSVYSVFSRTIDKIAEDLALEILRDVAFRDELRGLVKVAMAEAVTQLGEPLPEREYERGGRLFSRQESQEIVRQARAQLHEIEEERKKGKG